jgi:hypothetical protein
MRMPELIDDRMLVDDEVLKDRRLRPPMKSVSMCRSDMGGETATLAIIRGIGRNGSVFFRKT